MKVVLLADVKKVGRKGEVVEVANGYAQSVLFPRKLALPGTPENLAKAQKAAALREDKKAFDHSLLAKTLKELDGKQVSLSAPANETGTLFKAIHEKQVIDAIKAVYGVSVPESVLKLDGAIKKTGEHIVRLEGEGEKASLIVLVG